MPAGEDISDLIYQLEEFYSDLISLDLNGIVLPQEAVALINDSLYTLTSTNTLMADHSEQPSCGRPFICISCEQLEYLIDLNFTAVSIAGILGVSRSTVYRRFKDYGLSIRNKYSSISDEMLDEIVQKILQQYPDCGQKMMSGHLKERGIVVQQMRVRDSMRRTDPQGTNLRKRFTLYRRQYNVNSPLELWHLDGNHKLIRYNLILFLEFTHDWSLTDGVLSSMEQLMDTLAYLFFLNVLITIEQQQC